MLGPAGQSTAVTEYYHRAVFAHVVGADLVLDLEPIREGEEECAAALRLLARLRRRLGVRFFDVVTTLFFRHWVAPRAGADSTLSDLVEEFCEHLEWEADWERCLDSG
jgi:hypothetical protein